MSEYVYLSTCTNPDFKEGGYADFYERPSKRDFYPWHEDGYLIVGRYYKDTNYDKLWGLNRFANINLVELIANFYLLDAVASCTLVPGHTPQRAINPKVLLEMIEAGFYSRSHAASSEGVALEAAIAFSRHVLKYADAIRDYMHYAMASEIQYHEVGHPIGDSWSTTVTGWHHIIEKFGYELPAKWMASAFDRDGWADGFGGAAWRGIADVALAYERGKWMGEQFGPREFLDRAFSLQHNGGTMFNKCNWSGGLNYVPKVLDAHANSNWSLLYNKATEDTRKIVLKYLAACGVTDTNKFLGTSIAATTGSSVVPPSKPKKVSPFVPNGETFTIAEMQPGSSIKKGMVIEKSHGYVYCVQASGPKKTTLKSVSSSHYWSGHQFNTSYVRDCINSGKWTLYTNFGTKYIIEKAPVVDEEETVSLPLKAGDVVKHHYSTTSDVWPITVLGWKPDIVYGPHNLHYMKADGMILVEAGWTPRKATKWLKSGTWIKTNANKQ